MSRTDTVPRPAPGAGFRWTPAPWGAVLQCDALLATAQHFFTARELMLREEAEWPMIAAFAGVSPADLLLVKQVHGAAVVDASDEGTRPWKRPEADIILSADPQVAIGVRVADCVPILLASDDGRVTAAVHAGWRGLAGRAPIAAVDALHRRHGVRPERLIAAIGPAIGPCCYEVGQDTRDAFVAAGHHSSVLDRWFSPRPAGKFQLDTWSAARDQLEGAGLLPGRIFSADLCTQTNPATFHSFRADGAKAGRMVAVIKRTRQGAPT